MQELKKLQELIWEVPKEGDMNVPGRIYGDQYVINHLLEEDKRPGGWSALRQIRNVATLPGIQKYSLALADVHPGYGAPIGGVAAFDLENGVITFGNIGFDINCLSGESEVLHEFGYRRKIKDFETIWFDERIKCFNPTSKILNTDIDGFLKLKPSKEVYKVKTETGREIIATADHPFYTPKGMLEISKIKNEKISIYPFKGVSFEEAHSDILVTEGMIGKLGLSKTSKLQVVKKLKSLSLLPLKMDNKKFPYLLKLMGYALGDGSFYYRKGGESGISFYGKEEDLTSIKEDINKIGFGCTNIYSRRRNHEIKTHYDTVKFRNVEKSVMSGSKALAVLMLLLGLPNGNKAAKNFVLPEWIFRCRKWQKRLLLAAFFGAELSSPKTMTRHKYNFYNPVISMNKKEAFVQSGREFFKQISELLKGFGIKSRLIEERNEYINKQGELSIRLRLQISNKSKNLIKLYSVIGFEYNKKRSFLANVATEYLLIKESVLDERKQAEKRAKELRKERGISARKIYEVLNKDYKWINFRFVERSIYDNRKTSARISFNWLGFDEFLKERTLGLGKTGQVWENIVGIEKIAFKEPVYDFTVENENHNFIANSFVVSNCGVRTLKTKLTRDEVEKKKEELGDKLFEVIPAGLGSTGKLRLSESELDEVIVKGAKYTVEKGYGTEDDLQHCEENGYIEGANPDAVSIKAKQRQYKQIGTLGSGNHYLEVQYVEEVFDEAAAKAFGLFKDQILVSIHCGSRALGHQVGSDYLRELEAATKKYNIKINDRELVCAPIKSPEGEKYFSAVKAGINTAFANRHVLGHLTREAFTAVFGMGEKEILTVYDVGHNTAKIEKHTVNGEERELLVHRKGSTRGFGPGREEVPEAYRSVGQPVIVGGTMGTVSYILIGTEKGMRETFGSTIHGAGRVMSRVGAIKKWRGEQIVKELASKGILIKGHSWKGLAEEAPGAYKDVTDVVDVMHNAGITRKVVKVRPLISVKG